ncbi:MAG: hypothetical protein ACK47E_03450 [Cyclobacteriaceae bacterium]|jgi:hypothetical protein
MAKTTAKTPIPKVAPTKVSVKAVSKASSNTDIEKLSKSILEKLKTLGLDEQLQADIEWCLGSYSYDKNPVGLIKAAHNALNLFKTELARKTKGVTAKLISDIEKAIEAA